MELPKLKPDCSINQSVAWMVLLLKKRIIGCMLLSLLASGSAHAQLSVPDSLYHQFQILKLKPKSQKRDSVMLSILFELIQHMHPLVGIPWNDSLRMYTNRFTSRFGYLLTKVYFGDSLNLRGEFREGTKLLLHSANELERRRYWAHAAFAFLRLGATGEFLHQSGTKIVDPMVYYNHALQLAIKSGHDDSIVQVMGYMADYNLNKKNYGAVIRNQTEAQRIILSNKYSTALKHYWSVVFSLGAAYLHLGQEKKATAYFEKSLQLIDSPGKKPYLQYTIYDNLTHYYYDKKQYKKAIQELKKTEYFLDKWKGDVKLADGDKYLTNVYSLYYENYKAINDLPKALFYLEKMQKQKELNIKNEMDQQYNELHEKYEADQNKIRISKLNNLTLLQENAKRYQFNYFLSVVLCLLVIILAIGYRSLRLTKKNAQVQLELSNTQTEIATLVIQTEEMERQRIAADLHDDLGGIIATINHRLDQSLKTDSVNDIQLMLGQVRQIAALAGDKVRTISHNLMPPDFERLGLVESVQQLINSLNDPVFQCVVFGQPVRLASELELNAYRILSELIHNVQKHAQARHVSVQLLFHTDSLSLVVEDDGIGNQSKKKDGKIPGIGLINISSRVNYLHAHWQTDATEHGTTTLVEIPYEFAPSQHSYRRRPSNV